MSAAPAREASPFIPQDARPLDPNKFRDPAICADGSPRASVDWHGLETLWFNTGTLCNLACANCYIESTPRNDALSYLSAAEVAAYLDEIDDLGLPRCTIGFTGGEPFLNRDLPAMLADVIRRGHRALVLTNAMRPMRRHEEEMLALQSSRFTVRVSLDHYTEAVHDAERGRGSFAVACEGLAWLFRRGFDLAVAGRRLGNESERAARAGFAKLFVDLGLDLDADDHAALVLFPEIEPQADVAEITDACWDLLGLDPASIMCATSRMVVKPKGKVPRLAACTLIPHDLRFDMGSTLVQARRSVALQHPNCARFCVLGGATCGR